MAPVWKDWKKKKNSLKLNVSKIKPDIKSGKPFKNIFFLILSILYFWSSFRRNYVSCCHPLISISSSFFEWKENRIYYCDLCDYCSLAKSVFQGFQTELDQDNLLTIQM